MRDNFILFYSYALISQIVNATHIHNIQVNKLKNFFIIHNIVHYERGK